MTNREAIEKLEWVYQNGFDNDFEKDGVEHTLDALRKGIEALEREGADFRFCTDCKEYDQEEHCCHRYSKVIRDSVQEMKDFYNWHDLRKDPDDLPFPEDIVEVACVGYGDTGYTQFRGFYENGKVHSENSVFVFGELCEWCEYCEETDDYIIPKGWYEHSCFCDVFGNPDTDIVAWREIELFKGDK